MRHVKKMRSKHLHINLTISMRIKILNPIRRQNNTIKTNGSKYHHTFNLTKRYMVREENNQDQYCLYEH